MGPNRWREFCLGLLRGGEVLIDDISVIEDPGGSNRQLISNGDFQSGSSGWRLLGNHGHSEVVDDPDDLVVAYELRCRRHWMAGESGERSATGAVGSASDVAREPAHEVA